MTTDPKGPGTRDSRLRHPLLLLAVCTGGYFLLALLLSNLRFQELYTGNWDLGIFQQAFWSTAHGHPLYEAGDYEMYGFGSLFQVHPAPLLLLLADVYTAVPEAGTLFLVQAAVVSPGRPSWPQGSTWSGPPCSPPTSTTSIWRPSCRWSSSCSSSCGDGGTT
jgi:hypothetical protein